MAIRTTSKLVQGILMSDYGPMRNGTLPSLEGFIASANVLTNRVVVCATSKSITHTDEELELIERWLAAHFYVMSDQPYEEKTTGKAKAVYQGKNKLGMRLEASKYGQSAMLIDYSGCLKAINDQVFATFTWLGKPPSTQRPYVDRD